MSLKENSKTYKSLPLELNPNWASRLPKMIWKGFDLTPNHGPDVLDSSTTSLAEALMTIHAPIEYLDFLILCEWLDHEIKPTENEIRSLEENLHFRWNEEGQKLLQLFRKTPPSFREWCFSKKLRFNDLRPILRADLAEISVYLEHFQKMQPSKTVGCEILELLCDLSLGPKVSELGSVFENSNAEAILEKLKALNAPISSMKDQARKEKVRSWPWPLRVKGEWKRMGDQAGVHVELFSTHPKDLELKIQELKKICEKWERDF